jgi:hypothetical protein
MSKPLLTAQIVRETQAKRLNPTSSRLLEEVEKCIEQKMLNSEEKQVFFYKTLTPYIRQNLAERGFKVSENNDRDGIIVTISWA